MLDLKWPAVNNQQGSSASDKIPTDFLLSVKATLGTFIKENAIAVQIGELYCYVNRDGSRMIEFANNWRDAAFQIPDVRNLLSDTSAAAHRHPGPGKAINGFTAPRIVVYKLQIIYLK